MTWMHFSVPSKTFVLGEYAVLAGEPGLVLTTAPRFSLQARQGAGAVRGIPADSPAGQTIRQNQALFGDYQIEFQDPYQGKGGFGASTAQFILIAALMQWIHDRQTISPPALLSRYLAETSEGTGIPPSGVDLLAQLQGGLCYIDKSTDTSTVFKWPFADLEYCLLHTGNKLATHHHLQQLSAIHTGGMGDIVRAGRDVVAQADSRQFIAAVRDYAAILAEKKCVDERTQQLLRKINTCQDILAAKGCGAMGTDVIFLLFKKGKPVLAWLISLGLDVVCHGQRVESGIEIKEEQLT